jgi:1-deoxy-D-xylulose-5-phosphate synthase
MIPGMSVASPMDAATLRNLIYTAKDFGSPLSIRYPRGKAGVTEWHTPLQKLETGKGRAISLHDGSKIAILSIGPSGKDVEKALEEVAKEGIFVDHYDMIWIKPLDTDLLSQVASKYQHIITIEDGVISGGFGSAVMEWLQDRGFDNKVKRLGIPDNWVYQGSVEELKHDCGYDVAGIVKAIKEIAL